MSDVFAYAKVMLFALLIVMLRPLVAGDVMFAHYAVRRNITYAVNITAQATSLARKGKHRSADLLYRRSPFGGFFICYLCQVRCSYFDGCYKNSFFAVALLF
ncbi:MAG: hypothetical protein IKL36_08220 [Clostridia bacterium]|nr:hypothetical protein [Clostridia bacterium]